MQIRRIKRIVVEAWKTSKVISVQIKRSKTAIFLDILSCYYKYRIQSNFYEKNCFFKLPENEREVKGKAYRKRYEERKAWGKEKWENRRFLYKWKDYKWELSSKRYKKRLAAYKKRYNMGDRCILSFDVHIERNHYLPGTISIGNDVNLSKHVYIDYSGELIIRSGVKIANGVVIETHHRDIEAYTKEGKDVNIPTKLLIEEDAYIGSKAIILDSCNYIGKCARIGAGAIVTKDIPDYAVAVGVPAKVVKILPH